ASRTPCGRTRSTFARCWRAGSGVTGGGRNGRAREAARSTGWVVWNLGRCESLWDWGFLRSYPRRILRRNPPTRGGSTVPNFLFPVGPTAAPPPSLPSRHLGRQPRPGGLPSAKYPTFFVVNSATTG